MIIFCKFVHKGLESSSLKFSSVFSELGQQLRRELRLHSTIFIYLIS